MKNILWIHVDGFRSDTKFICQEQSGLYLSGFDYLDNKYVKLEKCYSHALSTIYSVAGYLTATYPFVNGVENNDAGSVPDDIEWFGQTLRKHGYKSKATFTTGPLHDNNFLRIGVGKCFDEIEFLHGNEYDGQYSSKMLAMNKLKEIIQLNNLENQFRYYTLLDMHGRDGRGLDGYIDEYTAGAIKVDYFLKTVLPMIDTDKTIVVVHGDHGWKFDFDHPKYESYCDFYGFAGYEPISHVGAYISELDTGDNYHDKYCNIVDIVPTLCDLLHIEKNENYSGDSLISDNTDHPVISFIRMSESERHFPPQIKWFKNKNDYSCPEIGKSNISIRYNDYQLVINPDTNQDIALFHGNNYSCVNFEKEMTYELYAEIKKNIDKEIIDCLKDELKKKGYK